MSWSAASLENFSLLDRRAFKASVFEAQSASMASAVDKLSVARRTIPPYRSGWAGASISERAPWPADAHLIASKEAIPRQQPTGFQAMNTHTSHATVPRLGDTPYYAFAPPSPPVFEAAPRGLGSPEIRKTQVDEEMWRVRAFEWKMQKNAFNNDVSAALRTSVRVQCKLGYIPKGVDPARVSENVRAALTDADTIGPAYVPRRPPLGLTDALPMYS